jgi:hypothetical protein
MPNRSAGGYGSRLCARRALGRDDDGLIYWTFRGGSESRSSQRVVPAKAGTHNHGRLWLRVVVVHRTQIERPRRMGPRARGRLGRARSELPRGNCNRPINAFLTLTAVTKWLRAEPVWGTAEAHLTLEIPWQPSKSHAEIRACDSGRPGPAIAPRMGFSRRKARRSAGI